MSLLHLEPRPVTTGGVLETRAFSMKANGKAFKVLIDGLYSDKVRAVIRELCSNAYDAHVAAGRADVPFALHLPTDYEPYFAVRDYGTSMTHEEVMGLYTTVFASSKESSSTQVGKLGLGSKSPFAYTDTFTVSTWLDGVRRDYSAYIGTDYIPQIALMSETPDDGPTGTEVTFPTQAEDTHAFLRAAAFTLIGFDVLPRMTGACLGDDLRGACVLRGSDWALYENLGNPYARQGCVVYPISTTALGGECVEAFRGGILVDFPIGALEIAASREGLGYDAATVAALEGAAERIIQDRLTTALAALDALPTIWEKACFISRLQLARTPSRVLRELRHAVFGDAARQGLAVDLEDVGLADATIYANDKLRRKTAPKYPMRSGTLTYHPDVAALTVFVDTSEKPVSHQWPRLKTLSNHWKSVTVVRYHGATNPAARADFMARLDGVPPEWFMDMKDIPVPPHVRARSSRTRVAARWVTDGAVTDWPATDLDVTTGGYYVPIERYRVAGTDGYMAGDSVYDIVQALRTLGVIPQNAEVYGIPLSRKSVQNPKYGWRNVLDLARGYLTEQAAPLARALRTKDWADRDDWACVSEDIVPLLPEGHPISVYATRRADALRYVFPQYMATLKSMGHTLRHCPWTDVELPPLGDRDFTRLVEPYPLLQHITEINDTNVEAAAQYINMLDAADASAENA